MLQMCNDHNNSGQLNYPIAKMNRVNDCTLKYVYSLTASNEHSIRFHNIQT